MPRRFAPAPTAHGRRRRERLLRSAAELVAQRGFHSVGIAEIGAAAGVTGSAIYRHFKNKQELLTALFDHAIEGLLDGARAAQLDGGTADEVLAVLVLRHVEFSLRDRAILAVYHQEAHNLPPDDRRRVRRKQRTYAEMWMETLLAIRPELSEADALTAVHATFGLLNAVANFHAPLDDETMAALLISMAEAALREAQPALTRSALRAERRTLPSSPRSGSPTNSNVRGTL
jgi:AcrR family transcriptional regulator